MRTTRYFLLGKYRLTVDLPGVLEAGILDRYFCHLRRSAEFQTDIHLDFRAKRMEIRRLAGTGNGSTAAFDLGALPKLGVQNVKSHVMACLWFFFHRENLVPVHGILYREGPEEPVVVSGASGIGKSTLLRSQIADGKEWLTDEFVLIGKEFLAGIPIPLGIRGNSEWSGLRGAGWKTAGRFALGKGLYLLSGTCFNPLVYLPESKPSEKPAAAMAKARILFAKRGSAGGFRPVDPETMAGDLLENWAESANPCLPALDKLLAANEDLTIGNYFEKSRIELAEYIRPCGLHRLEVPGHLGRREFDAALRREALPA